MSKIVEHRTCYGHVLAFSAYVNFYSAQQVVNILCVVTRLDYVSNLVDSLPHSGLCEYYLVCEVLGHSEHSSPIVFQNLGRVCFSLKWFRHFGP